MNDASQNYCAILFMPMNVFALFLVRILCSPLCLCVHIRFPGNERHMCPHLILYIYIYVPLLIDGVSDTPLLANLQTNDTPEFLHGELQHLHLGG